MDEKTTKRLAGILSQIDNEVEMQKYMKHHKVTDSYKTFVEYFRSLENVKELVEYLPGLNPIVRILSTIPNTITELIKNIKIDAPMHKQYKNTLSKLVNGRYSYILYKKKPAGVNANPITTP